MPTSSIAQILLRLFALNWFLLGLIQIGGSVFVYRWQAVNYFRSLDSSLIYITAAVVLWLSAPKLSRLLAKRNDGEFSLSGVTERQLYSTAFLVLGLYFALSSFANVFSWIHFFSIHKSPDYGFHRESAPSYYSLAEGLLTLIAGVALMLTARTWAIKLTRTPKKDQVDSKDAAERPDSESPS